MTVIEELYVNQDLVESYAKARPTYPPALFQLLASLTSHHELAWDVGTGNGQAAFSVAEHYKSVVATDVSEPQLSLAKKRHNITYARMSATPDSAEEVERIVGPAGSVDLVTVAAALHWFDLDKFYPIVKRVLRKPGGVFAAFTYSPNSIRICPEFDEELKHWVETTKPYRTLSRLLHPLDLPFPFDPVPVSGVEAGKGVEGSPLELKMERRMSFDDFMLMVRSFSAVQKALEKGVDLLNADVRQNLSAAWGPESVRTVTFPIFALIGTVS